MERRGAALHEWLKEVVRIPFLWEMHSQTSAVSNDSYASLALQVAIDDVKQVITEFLVEN